MKNGVILQYFEWNMPADGNLWNQLAEDAGHLKQSGITAVWIPPAYKGNSAEDVGYGVYDLYDFGEFDQKGTVRTKYGTRKELENAVKALHDNGIQVILDTVLNHKMGGDEAERFMAVPVEEDDRTVEAGEPREIEAYTSFTFPGRGNKYSSFKWHWYHFSGVDYDELTGDTCIFRILGEGKGWSQGVDSENGNYDYLMGNDTDVDNPEVVEELCSWGKWAVDTFGFDGFRMDAVKHIDYNFTKDFLNTMRKSAGKNLYAVSEYWSKKTEDLTAFVSKTEGTTDLFDVPLHFNFYRASEEGEDFDMGSLLSDTLVEADPQHAVTFVENHDSQDGSSLQSVVQDWFKPMAYALILLMKDGYPVIFYGDYYSLTKTVETAPRKGSSKEPEKKLVREESPHRKIIDILLEARRKYAYGREKECLTIHRLWDL